MGLLLKIAIFAVAAYTVWAMVRRWYGVLGGRPPAAPPAPADRPQPAKAPPRATIEDTYPCKKCGAYVMASARKCERADCPQPA